MIHPSVRLFYTVIALLFFIPAKASLITAILDSTNDIAVYNPKDAIPTDAKIIDDFKIGDNGFTTDCQYERVLEKAKEKAKKAGGNAIQLIEVKAPDMWSSCYRIKGNVLQIQANDLSEKLASSHSILEDDEAAGTDSTSNYATLYLYRPKSSAGFAVSYTINLDDSAICRITNNSKFEIKIYNPGAHKIWAKTEAKAIVPIDVKLGKSYYIKCGVQMGFWVGQPQLTLVYPSQGKAEYELVKGKR